MYNSIDKNMADPCRGTYESGAYDLPMPEEITFEPHTHTFIDTGWCFDGNEVIILSDRLISKHWSAEVFLKSKYTLLHTLSMSGGCHGLIDNDYRGSIKAKIWNYGDEPITIPKGKAVLQMEFREFGILKGEKVPTKERTGGYGSTRT